MSKLKILCLHGHHQTAATFREKTGGLRKSLKLVAEFVFIDSPIQEGSLKSAEPDDETQTWFTNTAENAYKRSTFGSTYNGTFDQSFNYVREQIENNGPFDGILSFSQGAAFAHAVLCQPNAPRLKFVIFCCGFISPDAAENVGNQTIRGIPTLHLINTNDQVIPNELSRELVRVFAEPEATVRTYDCGHCIPPSRLCKDEIVEFLTPFR